MAWRGDTVSVSLGDLAARTPSTPPPPTKPARRLVGTFLCGRGAPPLRSFSTSVLGRRRLPGSGSALSLAGSTHPLAGSTSMQGSSVWATWSRSILSSGAGAASCIGARSRGGAGRPRGRPALPLCRARTRGGAGRPAVTPVPGACPGTPLCQPPVWPSYNVACVFPLFNLTRGTCFVSAVIRRKEENGASQEGDYFKIDVSSHEHTCSSKIGVRMVWIKIRTILFCSKFAGSNY